VKLKNNGIKSMLSLKLIKYHIIIQLAVLVFLSTVSCSADMRFSNRRNSQNLNKKYYEGQVLSGTCSYYGAKFHGRKTASGEVYNMYDSTAAHRTLPFGTILEVENLKNGKKVRVKVNDRGPFKKGRILDISYAAAQKIKMIQSGTAKIKAVIIKLGKSK
jgi:rare lipoprotein A